LLSTRLVKKIKEEGEAPKNMVAMVMRKSLTRGIRKNLSSEAIKARIAYPVIIPVIRKYMMTYRF